MGNEDVGAYLVCSQVGDVWLPGSPILHLNIVVLAATGRVSGRAVITDGTEESREIADISGEIRYTGYGNVIKSVTLSGTYHERLQSRGTDALKVPFSAHLDIDDAWNGSGGFTCGELTVDNAPARNTPCQHS